ncbi:Protein of unknown function [Cotesia congregata]|uniref:Uncharacterized protein n=1 Tax=Cotesia congregata TaxID=51543 RepID=A0A8J2HE47_COTCN|nr:Protein of unknown function [Cotesia congregata]
MAKLLLLLLATGFSCCCNMKIMLLQRNFFMLLPQDFEYTIDGTSLKKNPGDSTMPLLLTTYNQNDNDSGYLSPQSYIYHRSPKLHVNVPLIDEAQGL